MLGCIPICIKLIVITRFKALLVFHIAFVNCHSAKRLWSNKMYKWLLLTKTQVSHIFTKPQNHKYIHTYIAYMSGKLTSSDDTSDAVHILWRSDKHIEPSLSSQHRNLGLITTKPKCNNHPGCFFYQLKSVVIFDCFSKVRYCTASRVSEY